MAYIINTYNTDQLTIVEDGTLDQTTDLKLVGKNYAGYGEIQNENFVFLLENFAGASEPPKAIRGQIWFDTDNSKLKFYDGTKWRTTGGAEVSAVEPSGLAQGDFWWDTDNEQLYAYNGSNFVLVGPQGVGETITRFQSRVIKDDQGTLQPVIVSLVNDVVVHIISSVQFTIGAQDAADYIGFDVVRKGLTLKNTASSQGGVTLGDMSGNNVGYRYWGTATNADQLGGQDASYYVSKNNPSFTGIVRFTDTGLTIGDSNDLVLKIVSGYKGVIANEQGDEILLQVNTDVNSNQQTMPLRIISGAILPGYANAVASGANVVNATGTANVNIGSQDHMFANVYATYLNGLASTSLATRIAGVDYTGSTAATANTMAARNATGDLYAQIFHGIATEARYADLAENYEADAEYEPGTVLVFGGEKEVTAALIPYDHRIAGVVSTNPAYLMNSETKGVPVALRGRVPCKVVGPVKKGDLLVTAGEPGVAKAAPISEVNNSILVIGKSLENSEDESIKLVEIVI